MSANNQVFKRLKRYRVLYLLILPAVLYMLIYRYYPIIIQAGLTFKNYSLLEGVWGSPWVGLDNLKDLFSSLFFKRIFLNTIILSVLRLAFGFFPPIILAIFLYDLKFSSLKRICQTLVYIPHFFSWVIVYAIVYAFFSNTGFVNQAINLIGWEKQNFFLDSTFFYPLLIGSAIWKEIGWGTIIYLAALMNIDPQLYEAAKIDGAGALTRIRHITIPGILPVAIFLFTLAIGRLFSLAGAEQVLLFYTPATYEVADIIDTWVYRIGLAQFKYSLGAAASFFQSFIGLILIIITNKLSTRYTGVGIW